MKFEKISFWVLILLFGALMTMSSMLYLTRQPAMVQALHQLGYPEYLLSILGTAKLLGVVALLQTRYAVLKEWAYAGFTINLIGASWSHAATGESPMVPLVLLLILAASYLLWKQGAVSNLTFNMKKTRLTEI